MAELTLSVTEAAELLGIGKASIYKAIREGRLAALRVGRKPKLRIPRMALDGLLRNPAQFTQSGLGEG